MQNFKDRSRNNNIWLDPEPSKGISTAPAPQHWERKISPMGTERQIGQHQQLTQSPEIGSAHSANQAEIDIIFIIIFIIKYFAVVVRIYVPFKIHKTKNWKSAKKNMFRSLSPPLN